VGTLYNVGLGEVLGLSSFKNFESHAIDCGEIAYYLLWYIILSHFVGIDS